MRRNHFVRKRWFEKFEKSNITNALNALYAKKIYPAYVSKHNTNCEKKVILLMIPNGKEWQYLPVKSSNIIESNNV